MSVDPANLRRVAEVWREGRTLEALSLLIEAVPSTAWASAEAPLSHLRAQLLHSPPTAKITPLSRAAAMQTLHTRAGRVPQNTLDTASARARVETTVSRLKRHPRLGWLAQELQTMAAVESDAPLKVAVFGVYSAGKSSLLNALLGDEGPRLPEALEPSTARLTEICWGPRPKLTVRFRDGREEERPIDALEGVVREGEELPEDVTRVRIERPVDLLRQLTLFDTPGFGSELDRHFEETQQLVAEVDVVLWVFNATKGGSEIEGEQLPHIQRSSGKSIGLVNQIDRVRPRYHKARRERWWSAVQGVLDDLEEKLGAHIDDWIPVSAAWLAEDHPESGRVALIEAFKGFEAQRRQIKEEASRRRLDEAVCLVQAWEALCDEEAQAERSVPTVAARLEEVCAREERAWREEWTLVKAERRTEVLLPTDAAVEGLAGSVLVSTLNPAQRLAVANAWQALDALARVLVTPGLGRSWRRTLERVVAVRSEVRSSVVYWRPSTDSAEDEPSVAAFIDALLKDGVGALAARREGGKSVVRRDPWLPRIDQPLKRRKLRSRIPGSGHAAADAEERPRWEVAAKAMRDRCLPAGVRWGIAVRQLAAARWIGAQGVAREIEAAERALRPSEPGVAQLLDQWRDGAAEGRLLTAALHRLPAGGPLRQDLELALNASHRIEEIVRQGRALGWSRRWPVGRYILGRGTRWVVGLAKLALLAMLVLGSVTLYEQKVGREVWLTQAVTRMQRWTGPAGVRLVRVPPGELSLGSAPGDPFADRDEALHTFTLGAPLLMTQTEVTQAQWEAIMGVNPVLQRKRRSGGRLQALDCRELGLGPDLPVSCVDWLEVVEFANRMSADEGLREAYRIEGGRVRWDRTADGYRLPTEEEWEYAARAGVAGTWGPMGSPEGLCAYGNVRDRSTAAAHPSDRPVAPCDDGFESTAPVGRYRANGFGLHDTLGNVWEWCWPGDHDEVALGGVRPARGGSWFNGPKDVRPSNRYHLRSDNRSPWMGARLVRPLREEEPVVSIRPLMEQLSGAFKAVRAAFDEPSSEADEAP